MGVIALSVALPLMASSVAGVVELAGDHLSRLIGGG
jgi:hypothetical protein